MKIGIILPTMEQSSLGRPLAYADIRDVALQAEEQGLDSLWVADHLLFRFPNEPMAGIWEAWSIQTALAEATRRVDLGQLVLCTAFRNPALLAKMAVTVDEISRGRLILGLGCGWHQPEFDAFGIPFDHRVERFEEALQIIVPLLKEGKVDFHGKHYSAPNCEMMPRGPRPNGPPVLVASKGPRMLRLTAQYADSWNTAWLGTADALAERRSALEAACADVGRDPGTLEVTVGVMVYYPDLAQSDGAPKSYLTGSAEEIGAEFARYAKAGVGHLICSCSPCNSAAVSRLAQAARVAADMIASADEHRG
jgi:alkanesulfonate monooxygenase SsuD/methylene tetrahydromethanopterin reductase-like flavin-dependent oxidoreductase (luciferase family)